LLLIQPQKGARQGAVQPVVHGKVIARRVGGVAGSVEEVGEGVIEGVRIVIRDARTARVIEGIVRAVVGHDRRFVTGREIGDRVAVRAPNPCRTEVYRHAE